MNFTALLGKSLKDDEVMEVLEVCQIDVIYDFDRTHENMPDRYWAGAKEEGFLLCFNENQILDTIFLYVQASEGYDPIDPEEMPYPLYETFDDAERAFKEAGISFNASIGEPGTKMHKWWVKGQFENHTRHYQFRDGRLFRVTVGAKNAAV